MSGSSLCLGVRALGSARWAGGTTYIANLLEALKRYAPELRVQLVAPGSAEGQGNAGVLRVPLHSGNRWRRLLDRMVEYRTGENPALRRGLQQRLAGRADAVFAPNHTFMGLAGVPGLYWIPDFQHRHLPELFQPGELERRDREFASGIRRARRVLLSSEDARNDLVRFFPEFAGKAEVVHFVARIPDGIYDTDPGTVAERYHLPEKFLYLPNQFWLHKNHRLVVSALEILAGKNISPVVVCTGNLFDRRDHAFGATLLAEVSRRGLRDQFMVLGLVPHDDVYALMRQAVAVLNPSLFEGWSTSVEEAKSLGKRVLLSDLGVHREQAPPGGQYFDRHSAEDCARRMAEVWEEHAPGPDPDLEAAARARLPGRTREYAQSFLSLVQACVAG